MESWSCVSGGMYGSASTGTISSSSSFPRNADVLKNWELRAPYRVGENVIFTWNQQSVESRCLVGLDYGELVGKHLATDSIREGFRSKYNGERVSSRILGTPVAYSGEDESPSKLSSSVVDSNSRDSSLIDLKLGRFVDNQDVASYFSKGTPILSSADSSKPPKKLRVGVSNFRTAYCQVYGCNKDLSSSKDYHKRHKVCEAHSKTAKVIVNGIEQRFCQQCSRFHLLAEFDDGKRSCRKRLAGHNERRRKPQVGIPSVRTGKILPAYAGLMGSRFQGMPTPTSFICHDILPNDPFHPEKYVASDWCRRIKTEDVTNISILSAIPSTAEHPHSKSAVPSSDYEKLFPSFNEQGPNAAAEYIFGEQSNRYPSYYGGTASGSRSLIQEGSLGSEEFNILNASPAIHELPGIADSGCALSLLSSQSQNSASQSSGILLALPLASSGTENHCNLGVSTQASSGRMSNRFSSLRLNPTAGGHLSPMMISNGSEAAEFNITDGIYQSSELFTPKDQLSCGDGQTIDLLQLSSQLQRVEQQRQSMSIKQENDAFCCLQIT